MQGMNRPLTHYRVTFSPGMKRTTSGYSGDGTIAIDADGVSISGAWNDKRLDIIAVYAFCLTLLCSVFILIWGEVLWTPPTLAWLWRCYGLLAAPLVIILAIIAWPKKRVWRLAHRQLSQLQLIGQHLAFL